MKLTYPSICIFLECTLCEIFIYCWVIIEFSFIRRLMVQLNGILRTLSSRNHKSLLSWCDVDTNYFYQSLYYSPQTPPLHHHRNTFSLGFSSANACFASLAGRDVASVFGYRSQCRCHHWTVGLLHFHLGFHQIQQTHLESCPRETRWIMMAHLNLWTHFREFWV